MRRRNAQVAASLVILALACGDPATVTNPDPPPRASAISLAPDSANLTFVGETTGFTASVTDQYDAAFPATVAWSSDAPEVFSVTTNGVVTAVSNGSGTVTASFGDLRAAGSVTVRQVSATATLASGGRQEALPGTALPDPIVVEVKDKGGVGVSDVAVVFSPADGHGSADPRTTRTNSSGQAATIWTMGPDPGPQLLTVSAQDGINVRVTAASTYGSAIEVVSGNRQRALLQTVLADPVVVRVLNSSGEPFAGTTVHFAPAQAHGLVSHDSVTANQAGEAAVLWTLGDSAGPHTLTASVPAGPSTELTATALTGLGVCDRTRQVRYALMIETDIRDCAEVEPHHLSEIIVVGLGSLDIASLYADDLAGLVNLQTLHLSNNVLAELPSGLFSDLGNLRSLDLSSNQLTSLPRDIFDALTNLRSLSLSSNQLSALPPDIFSDLVSLDSLGLSAIR